jgi:hypothetical protein
MNALELYEQAGKPDRAIITFDKPTKIAKGLRPGSNKIVISFEAYLLVPRTNTLAYYFSSTTSFSFQMPENVIKIEPVDIMELWRRARKAANYIKADKVHGRELDNAFENYDGEEMCCALIAWRSSPQN